MSKILEALRKDGSDPTLKVGDIVFCRGTYQQVQEIHVFEAGSHPDSPIHNDWKAREVVTKAGSRWHGIKE